MNAPDRVVMRPEQLDLARIASQRAKLWEAGYRPIAILAPDHPDPTRAGKSPAGRDWTERARRDPPEAVVLPPVLHLPNTGILCDGLRAVDVDIDDHELAASIRALALNMLGAAPIRFRENSGRCLLLYRAASGEPKKRVLSGRLGKVEVLGHGQQFVAFGVHPSGAALHWTEAIESVSRESLPDVIEEQITALFAEIAPLIEVPTERKPSPNVATNAAPGQEQAPSEILDVIAALAVIPNDGPADWDHWNSVGMATWRASTGSVFGFNGWCAWSAKHPEHDLGACRARWDHYPSSPPDQTGAGKLFKMAAEACPGWRKPSSSRLMEATADAVWADNDEWSEADLPARPWVVPGYLLRGAVTLLCGPPSAMKSSLMLGWACALGLERTFGRFKPSGPAPVIVYNVEDDRTEQRRRLSAALRQFGASPSDLGGRAIRTGPSGIGTLLVRDDTGVIRPTAAMDRLEQLIEQHGAAVLIVDPLAELHTAEENDNTAIRSVVAKFRELAIKHNVAVVILHHTRKGGAASPGDPDIARGASAIIGAVRIALTLTGMSEADAQAFGLATDAKARSQYIRLDDAKQNYAPIRDAEWFEKVAHALDNGETVPAATPWSPPAAKVATQGDLTALTTSIERGTPGGEPWSPKLSKDERSVRSLLEAHGFIGADAQKTVLARLEAECGIRIARYRQAGRRNCASGLRVDGKPPAVWAAD